MKKKWSTLFYVLTLGGSVAVIYWIIKQGRALQSPLLTAKEVQSEGESAARSSFGEFAGSFSHNITEPIAVLLMQIIIIIFFARVFGYFFKKINQPAVIGEIFAGIILGPLFWEHIFRVLLIFCFLLLHWAPLIFSARSALSFLCSSSEWNSILNQLANRLTTL